METGIKFMSREEGGRGGVIVNISSTCGVTCHGDMFTTPAYTASKHAVTALTRTFGVSDDTEDNSGDGDYVTEQVLAGEDWGLRGGSGSLLH